MGGNYSTRLGVSKVSARVQALGRCELNGESANGNTIKSWENMTHEEALNN